MQGPSENTCVTWLPVVYRYSNVHNYYYCYYLLLLLSDLD